MILTSRVMSRMRSMRSRRQETLQMALRFCLAVLFLVGASSIRPQSLTKASQEFDAIDSDKDGVVPLHEFTVAHMAASEQHRELKQIKVNQASSSEEMPASRWKNPDCGGPYDGC